MAKNGHVEKMNAQPMNIDVKTEQKVFNVEQKKAMFAAYATAHEASIKAQKVADDTKDAEGGFVQTIMEALGNGPFNYKGTILTAICRNNKDGSKTYFFKRPSDNEIQEIG
jgi:hypothetical protein